MEMHNNPNVWKRGEGGLTAEGLDPCFSVLLQPADLSPQLKLHCRQRHSQDYKADSCTVPMLNVLNIYRLPALAKQIIMSGDSS